MPEENHEISAEDMQAAPTDEVRGLGEEVDLDSVEGLEESMAESAALQGPAAVQVARGQVGVQEAGGEDRGVPYERYVRYFGAGIPPSPWCAFFVSWCFAQSDFRPPWSNPGYVPTIHSWAQANGKLVNTPAHGDLFGLGGDHIGFVAGANPSQKQIYTCEGNYSDKVGSRLVAYASAGLWFARV
jgi:hypothetical protein